MQSKFIQSLLNSNLSQCYIDAIGQIIVVSSLVDGVVDHG